MSDTIDLRDTSIEVLNIKYRPCDIDIPYLEGGGGSRPILSARVGEPKRYVGNSIQPQRRSFLQTLDGTRHIVYADSRGGLYIKYKGGVRRVRERGGKMYVSLRGFPEEVDVQDERGSISIEL